MRQTPEIQKLCKELKAPFTLDELVDHLLKSGPHMVGNYQSLSADWHRLVRDGYVRQVGQAMPARYVLKTRPKLTSYEDVCVPE